MYRTAIQYLLSTVLIICLTVGCNKNKDKDVCLEELLDEMVSVEENARFPAFMYTAEVVSGQIAKQQDIETLFNVSGPGVITRFMIVSPNKKGSLKFFFDGSNVPDLTLSSLDFANSDFLSELVEGDNTSFLPVPYAHNCRIVYESEQGDGESEDKFYRIDYRTYSDKSIKVETFSTKILSNLKKKIAQTAILLKEPETNKSEQTITGEAVLKPGEPTVVQLPSGTFALYELKVNVTQLSGSYEQSMRDVILQFQFDGLQTVRVPLSDFSGGGMWASAVKSRYTEADGRGNILSRWLMPYREVASMALINEGVNKQKVRYSISVSPIVWDKRMLYFHASWNEETGTSKDSILTIINGGRGVYKGDAVTLFNYTTKNNWFTNSRISTQKDAEKNFFQPVLEGFRYYYNIPSSVPVVSQTPFGGMVNVGLKSSYGYNSFLRIQCLDDIPFSDRLTVLIDRNGASGKIDFANTMFWYGDNKARPEKIPVPAFQSRTLPSAPSSSPAVEE